MNGAVSIIRGTMFLNAFHSEISKSLFEPLEYHRVGVRGGRERATHERKAIRLNGYNQRVRIDPNRAP